MLKYIVLIFLPFAKYSFGHSSYCGEVDRSKWYLDIASEMISNAKSSIPSAFLGSFETKVCEVEKATDCADLYKRGYTRSGTYDIWPMNRLMEGKPLEVYCDMDTDGGGWTVIQRRGNFGNPDDYFNKHWLNYKEGFGKIKEDFWLGNDKIFILTNRKLYSVRFDLKDQQQKKFYAKYEKFWIDDEYNNYTLHVSNYSGDAGDAISVLDGMKFSTRDKPNDNSKTSNCAETYKGGWWFNSCYAKSAHLNGAYNVKTTGGIHWLPISETKVFSATEIKIRPKI